VFLSYFQSYFSLLQVLHKSIWILSFNLSQGLCKLFTNSCKAFSIITFDHYHKLASIIPKSSRFHWFKKSNSDYLQYFNTTFKIHIESHSFYFHIHEPILRFNISSEGNICNCWDQNHGLLPKCPCIWIKTILILCSKIHILILNLTLKKIHILLLISIIMITFCCPYVKITKTNHMD
jgi:hypothetical protein